ALAGGLAWDLVERAPRGAAGVVRAVCWGHALVGPLRDEAEALEDDLVAGRVGRSDLPGGIRARRQLRNHWRTVAGQHRADQFPRRLVGERDDGSGVVAGVVPL